MSLAVPPAEPVTTTLMVGVASWLGKVPKLKVLLYELNRPPGWYVPASVPSL